MIENGQMVIKFTVNIIKACLIEWFVPLNFTLVMFSPGPDVFRTKHKIFSGSRFKDGLTSFSFYRT